MRLTLGSFKNDWRNAKPLGVCPATDPRFIQWLNEAQYRLLIEGKWYGTTARFNICATDGCITLPPQIAVIEAVNVCGNPAPIHDFWFEFLESGPGSSCGQNACGSNATTPGVCSGNCGGSVNLRGYYPTFDDIRGTDKLANFICDLASDVGKRVLILGYDQNANWIRTIQNGIYADGEIVLLSQGAGTNSLHLFSTITDIQFLDDMDGQSWLYEFNTTTTLKRLIGHYEYFEKNPNYARYFFPGILSQTQTGTGTCNQVKVEIIGKLEFIPAKVDTDYLIISNPPALKEMMLAIRDSENESDRTKANSIILAGLSVAKSILDSELDHYQGTGRRIGINISGSSVGAVDPVPNFI